MSTRSKALASARSAYLSCSAHWHGQCCNGSIASIARDRQLFDDRKRNGDHLLTLRGQAEQRSLQVCPIRTIESELTSARYDVTDAQSDLYFAKKNAEALQDELASVKSELEETRGRLYEAENELAQTQECLYRTENVLEETRDWLCETDDALVQTRDQLEETEDELASVKSELSEAKFKLRRTEEDAKLTERYCESLRRTYRKAMLELLEVKRQRDTARRIAKKLIAKRNNLRYELIKARIGFEFYQHEYADAEARVADAKKQIKDLERDVKIRDKVIGSLLDDVVIRTKG